MPLFLILLFYAFGVRSVSSVIAIVIAGVFYGTIGGAMLGLPIGIIVGGARYFLKPEAADEGEEVKARR